jgi:uncharacterized protein YcbX
MGPFGLLGDRRYAVVGADGVPVSARRATGLLGYRANYADREGAEGPEVTTPDGGAVPPDDPALAARLSAELGHDVVMGRSPVGFPDAAHVHLVSESSLAQVEAWLDLVELDRRRFRANVLVELAEDRPFGEAEWIARRLQLGEGPVLQVVSPTERCVVTTVDPDTLERDKRILATLARERDNFFGVYARVLRPGWVEVGDAVCVVPPGAPG